MEQNTRTWHSSRAIRVTWIVIQIVLALWMARRGVQFYYQGF